MGRVYRPSVDMDFCLREGVERRPYQRRFEDFIIVRSARRLFLFVQAGLRLALPLGDFPAGAGKAKQRIVKVCTKALMHRPGELEFELRRGIAYQPHDIVQRRRDIGMASAIERLDKRPEMRRESRSRSTIRNRRGGAGCRCLRWHSALL